MRAQSRILQRLGRILGLGCGLVLMLGGLGCLAPEGDRGWGAEGGGDDPLRGQADGRGAGADDGAGGGAGAGGGWGGGGWGGGGQAGGGPAGGGPAGGDGGAPGPEHDLGAAGSGPLDLGPPDLGPFDAPPTADRGAERPTQDAGAGSDAGTRGQPEDPADPTDPEDPLDPDERGEVPPWPIIADCAEVQATACHSNYTCGRDTRCEDLGAPDLPVRCCVPGPRGPGGAGAACPRSGADDCLSGVCVAASPAEIPAEAPADGSGPRWCSLRCGQPEDCPRGLRRCEPLAGLDPGERWCQPDGGHACAVAGPGDLLINEILPFAPVPERAHEFIELVNRADTPVALADLSLRSNRGEGLVERVAFLGGCLPAGGRVAVYEDAEAWRWSPAPASPPVVRTRLFGLSNVADVQVELVDADGVVIDAVGAPAALLGRGVSLNRAPDATPGAPLVRHDTLSLSPSSPGAAP